MIMVFGYDSSGCSRVWAIEALKFRSPEFYMYPSTYLPSAAGLSNYTLRYATIGLDSGETADALEVVDLGHNVAHFTLV